ncbi:MAG: hypothetical protein FWC55_08000 [Firmicutes bacterium]|nr:hypothetical protein [Bacillota bacterium]
MTWPIISTASSAAAKTLIRFGLNIRIRPFVSEFTYRNLHIMPLFQPNVNRAE